MKKEINIEKPTEEFARKYIERFSDNSNGKIRHYPFQEKAVVKIRHIFPKNIDITEILLKVGILNSFYSTNIFKPFAVAEHIRDLDIDEKLEKGDLSIINDIAENKISGKNKRFYSFATKYCSMHNPEKYPIYDSYIGWILNLYKKQFKFSNFKIDELRDYGMFKKVLQEFKTFFGLEKLTFKELDQFLWMYAKEIKPNNYKESSI